MPSPEIATLESAPPPLRAENPFVFLVGAARSGTTLLQRILDAHPLIAITPETHWIPRLYRKRTGLTPEGVVTPALTEVLMEYRHFKKMEITREELEALIAPRPHYSQFVARLFDLYGRKQGKQLVGDKTPGYERRMPVLHELWPHAKFLHLIRDGRDVCLSMLNWDKAPRSAGRLAAWPLDPVCTTAYWWKWHVLLGRQYERELPAGSCLEIRYETLVARGHETCESIAEFLGVPFEEKMVRFADGRTRNNPALDAKHAWLPITSGLRDWRTQMPAGDVEKFEACVGDTLEELGYERHFPAPSESARQIAHKIREAFNAEVQPRGDALPKQW